MKKAWGREKAVKASSSKGPTKADLIAQVEELTKQLALAKLAA